jgi:hypothetical protein
MGSTPTRGELRRSVMETILVKYSKWRTKPRPDLLNRVNGSYNRVELLTNSIYGVSSVVVCTLLCESDSMGSFPI